MQINKTVSILLILTAHVGLLRAVPLSREELMSSIAYENGTDTVQLLVPSQFDLEENGNASCGYQATYNGLAIRDILQLKDQTQRTTALAKLKEDIDSRNKKFSSAESPWRSAVIKSHVQDELRPVIEEQIGLLYKGAQLIGSKRQNLGICKELANGHLITFPAQSEEDLKCWEKLWGEIRTLSRIIGEEISLQGDNGSSYTIPAAHIKKQLKKRLKERRDNPTTEDKESFAKLLEPEMLESLIDFKDIAVSAPRVDIGNWIDSHDIELVLDAEKADRGNVFITGNNQLRGNDPLTEDKQLIDFDPKTKKPLPTEFNEFVEQFKSNEGAVTGTFLIYLKSLSQVQIDTTSDEKTVYNKGMLAGSHGHWITLVADRKGDKRQFLLANSSSGSCIEHYRVKELKCLLEGDTAYVTDGRFAAWIKEAQYAASPLVTKLLNRLKENSPEFVQQNPLSVGVIGGILASALCYYLLDKYNKRKSSGVLRSPEQMAEQNVSTIAVH